MTDAPRITRLLGGYVELPASHDTRHPAQPWYRCYCAGADRRWPSVWRPMAGHGCPERCPSCGNTGTRMGT